VPRRNPPDRVHVSTLPEQMDWHDRFGFLGDSSFDLGRVNVVRVGANVDEDGLRTSPADCSCCCEECKRRRDDFIALTDFQAHQRQQQGIGTGGASDGFPRIAVLGDIAFKL
jgi:hypothetical protein